MREIDRGQYLRLLRSGEPIPEGELFAVFEEGLGVGMRNYHTLIKGGAKLLFLEG